MALVGVATVVTGAVILKFRSGYAPGRASCCAITEAVRVRPDSGRYASASGRRTDQRWQRPAVKPSLIYS